MSETLAPQETRQSLTNRSAVIAMTSLVFLVSLGWFLVGIKDMALIDRDEPMIAEVARQMVHRGEWLTPHLPAWEEKSIFKPPLAMWIMAGSFKIFGVNEQAARLPSTLCAAMTAALLFAAAARRWGRSAGLVAAACMIVPLLPTVVGHMAVTDSLLTLLATIILLCLERSLRVGGSPACNLAMWVLAGAAMLIKGPAILAFLGPALVMAADGYRWRRYALFVAGMVLLVLGGKAALADHQTAALVAGSAGAIAICYCFARWLVPLVRLPVGIAWGVPLMLATAGWWFVYVSTASPAHGESAKRFMLFEILTRIAQPMENHSGLPGFYLAVLAGGLLPFTAAIVPLAAWSLRRPRPDPAQGLLWAWAIGSWALCEIASTKLPHYILPALPALALLAAAWWRQADDLDIPISRKRAVGLILPAVLFAAAVGSIATVAWHQGLRIWLVDRLLEGKPDIAGRIAYLATLQTWQVNDLLAAPALLLATAGAAFVLARRRGLRWGLRALVCGWVPASLILLVALLSASPFSESLSREAARQAVAMGTDPAGLDSHPPVRYYAVGYTEPAVFFYLPADRYTRVEGRLLSQLVELDQPFVLIASRKFEPEIRGQFGQRIAASKVVSGLNLAKGAPETACVMRIVPNGQPEGTSASRPAAGPDTRETTTR